MSAVALPLLAADPVFPQRDLLLDPAYVARRIAPRLGTAGAVPIAKIERVRVTYRAGKSLRVLYKLEADGQPCMLAARVFAADTKCRPTKAATLRATTASLQPVFCDEENNTVYWTFPHDRKIGSLSLLMTVPKCLSELLGSKWTQSRLVAYAPEKSATVQCLDDDSKVLAYAKCYAGHEGFLVYRRYNELAHVGVPGGRFAVPRALAYSSSLRMLVLEPVEGKRIADLEGEELLHGFEGLGRALASLHSMPVGMDVPRFSRLDSAQLREAALLISFVRPDVGEQAQRLADSLCSTQNKVISPDVQVHGDVHPKNGILRGDQVVLIDLDQSGSAPAAADLGSLLASLRYDVVIGIFSAAQENLFAGAFLSGYASVRRLPNSAALRWHTAAALLAERAARAVSRVRVEGLENLPELLLEATRMLEESQ